jgi:ketosteroid isomerase-like protein
VGERRDPEQTIRAAYEAFAQRDLERLGEVADPEIEIVTVTGMLAGRGDPYRGAKGLADYLADVASTWDRLELFPQSFHQLDDERWLVLGRVRAWRTGASADSPNAWLWTLRDGLVVRAEVFADPSEARQLLD